VAFRNLNEALKALRLTERLVEIEQTLAPRFECAACLSRAAALDKGAVLFTSLKGHEVSAVGNLVYSEDVLALEMGVSPGGEYTRALRERLKSPVKPKEVENMPVEEVLEPEASLSEVMPIFTYYEGDSGPFVTTGLLQTIDPDTGETARGIHRMELRGDRELGAALLNPPLSSIYAKYKERGERMPVAVVIGMTPLIFASFAFKGAAGADKLSVAGGLRGEAVEVGRAKETGILVPAEAEFLLEGYVDPATERQDGPLGEIGGYSQLFTTTPSLFVTRITHRKNPIYHALLPDGPEGDVLLREVAQTFIASQVEGEFEFFETLHLIRGTFGSSVVVSLSKAESSQIRALLERLLNTGVVKKAVAVASDIDPTRTREVEWSMATRYRPDEDTIILSGLKGSPIDPSTGEDFTSSKLGIDATGYGHNHEHLRVKIQPDAADLAAAIISGGRS